MKATVTIFTGILMLGQVALADSSVQSSGILWGEQPQVDRSAYHLFKPMPKELARGLDPDRSEVTESPLTLDPGHFVFEMTWLDYNRDRASGLKTETWSFGSLELKVGLLHNLELMVEFDSYVEERSRNKAAGFRETASGFSDIELYLKRNIWGNEGDTRTEFGIMSFLSIPTGTAVSSDKWGGGLILPFAVSLSEDKEVGFQVMTEFVHDDDRDGYNTEFGHSIVFEYEPSERLGIFTEYVGVIGSSKASRYEAMGVLGATWQLNENQIIDGGIRVGLNSAADDFGFFVGSTLRF